MPCYADFTIPKRTDATLTITLTPPVPIGGWRLESTMTLRFGGASNLLVAQASSGFIGVSGINVINSGQGTFTVAIRAQDTSGLDFGIYAFKTERLDSGARTVLQEGFLTLTPA